MRNPDAGMPKSKKKSSKQFGMTQFIIAGVVIVAVIVALFVIVATTGKKPAAPRTKAVSSEAPSVASKPKTTSTRETSARAKREEERARLREERRQQRQEARQTETRTSRTSSGGYTSGRVATSSASELRAILTDNTGARTALVGERRLKAGDDVEGRRIVEVTGDGVKVEYRENTYTVRIGQKVY